MKESDIKEADRKLKMAISKGVKGLSEEKINQVLRLKQLKDCLRKIEKLEIMGLNLVAEKSKNILSVYDGLNDRKYWNDYALFYVIMAISCRVADAIEEACQMYDEFKK